MELSSLYLKSGLKNVGIVFLMTDAQVPSESFLVLINDMLSTGEIPELFPDDEVENIIAGVRNEVNKLIFSIYIFIMKYKLSMFPKSKKYAVSKLKLIIIFKYT